MGFKVTTQTQDTVTVGERLWLTEDKERLVPEGDPEAAFLFCAAGNRVPRAEAERYGLLDDQGDDAKPLDRLKKAELIDHAAKLDPPLELEDSLTKAALIEAIEAHVPAESEAETPPT